MGKEMENQVQRLLQSEKEVNRQVQQALENKRKKLSTIQGEAEIAVKQFKEELEAQMKATVAQKRALMNEQSGTDTSGAEMKKLEGEFEQNKDAVVEMLIENVMAVDWSIPRVVRGKFGEDEN